MIHDLYVKRTGMALKSVEEMELFGTPYDIHIPLKKAVEMKLIDKVTITFRLFERTAL